MKKKYFSLLELILFFLMAGFVFFGAENASAQKTEFLATSQSLQENSSTLTIDTGSQDVALDESVSINDLGIKPPRLLPDSPFYFLKNWTRGIESFFTFDPIKKFELKSRLANERLAEIEEMIQERKNTKAIEKATENYEKELGKIENIAKKIKEKAEKNPKLNKFLDKWTKHQLLQQKLLEKLEKQAPPQIIEKIKTARKRHLERFKNVMLKLENEKNIPKRLEKAIEAEKGSPFKGVKAIERLRELEKIAPEKAKKSIKQVEEKILEKTKKVLEKMPPKRRMALKNYLENISGDPAEHMKIAQEITNNQKLKELREKVIERMSKKIEKISEKRGCPKWTAPSPGFCPNGKIIIKRDKNNCPLAPVCTHPIFKKAGPIGRFKIMSKHPRTGLANPASVYCKKLGYKLEIKKNDNGGEYGICIFPDGNQCEEWKFFRGECGKEYKKLEKNNSLTVPTTPAETNTSTSLPATNK